MKLFISFFFIWGYFCISKSQCPAVAKFKLMINSLMANRVNRLLRVEISFFYQFQGISKDYVDGMAIADVEITKMTKGNYDDVNWDNMKPFYTNIG